MKFLVFVFVLGSSAAGQQNSAAVPFLPEVFSQFPNVRDFTLSSEQDEAYFTAQSHMGDISVLLSIRKLNGRWSEPAIVSFSGRYQDLEPFLTPDGLRLFFVSNRPATDSTDKTKDFDIWYVRRKSVKDTWSTPVNLGAPVNSDRDEFYPSVSVRNNLYFTSDAPGSKGKDDIFFCAWMGDRYADPVSLSDSVNSSGYEFNATVSPDESFLLFSGYNREDGFGSGDLYISYSNRNGEWSKAVNLGSETNSDKMDYCPFVSLETNTLYFTSKRNKPVLPAKGFSYVKDLLKVMHQYDNGLSRVYAVPIDKVPGWSFNRR